MRILLFLLLVFCSNLSAQTSVVRAKYFYKYEFTDEPSSCEEANENAPGEKRCIWMVNYKYPEVKLADVSFSNTINKAIRQNFDYEGASDKPLKIKKELCADDRPGADFMSYKVVREDAMFLSLAIYKDMEPSGMGNGFRHEGNAITFDLKKKQKMRLGDVVKAEYDSLIYKHVIAILKDRNVELFSEFGEINNPYLFETFSVLGSNFALTNQSVVLYFPLSYGGKQSFEEVEMKFSEHSTWFDDKQLLNLAKSKPAKQLPRKVK